MRQMSSAQTEGLISATLQGSSGVPTPAWSVAREGGSCDFQCQHFYPPSLISTIYCAHAARKLAIFAQAPTCVHLARSPNVLPLHKHLARQRCARQTNKTQAGVGWGRESKSQRPHAFLCASERAARRASSRSPLTKRGEEEAVGRIETLATASAASRARSLWCGCAS